MAGHPLYRSAEIARPAHLPGLTGPEEAGHDTELGARPLKRAIQRELETAIAKGILGGQFTAGHTVAVDVAGE